MFANRRRFSGTHWTSSAGRCPSSASPKRPRRRGTPRLRSASRSRGSLQAWWSCRWRCHQEADHLPRVDLHADVAQHRHQAVVGAHVSQLEHRRRSPSRSSGRLRSEVGLDHLRRSRPPHTSLPRSSDRSRRPRPGRRHPSRPAHIVLDHQDGDAELVAHPNDVVAELEGLPGFIPAVGSSSSSSVGSVAIARAISSAAGSSRVDQGLLVGFGMEPASAIRPKASQRAHPPRARKSAVSTASASQTSMNARAVSAWLASGRSSTSVHGSGSQRTVARHDEPGAERAHRRRDDRQREHARERLAPALPHGEPGERGQHRPDVAELLGHVVAAEPAGEGVQRRRAQRGDLRRHEQVGEVELEAVSADPERIGMGQRDPQIGRCHDDQRGEVSEAASAGSARAARGRRRA